MKSSPSPEQPKKRSRPSKRKKRDTPYAQTICTPEITQIVADYVRAGNYVDTAAAAAGISKVTLYDWMRKGGEHLDKAGRLIEPREPYKTFKEAVDQALAEAEATDITIIRKAAAGGVWQASAWRLERRFPSKWGRREAVDHTSGGKPVKFTFVIDGVSDGIDTKFPNDTSGE